MNEKFTATEIIEQINILNDIFRESRAYYPYIEDEDIGKVHTRPFNNGKNIITIHYEKPITKEFKESNNKIAHFLNQNFLLRLFAILDSYGIWKGFKQKDSCELYALKQFRNIFGHSLGTFDKTKELHRNVMRRVIRTFHLEDKEYQDFPISIDTVINKIVLASIKYVRNRFA